ncbi:MAG: hypothetical protein ACXW3F_08850 [Pyrinomonadaceae bacterium]
MVLRIVLSIVLGAVAFTLGGPILYYFWVGPQSAAALALAKESDDEIKHIADTKTFSREDYRASMQRTRDREARYQQILAEKRRKRTRTWQIAIVSALVIGGSTFAVLSLRSKRRGIVAATTEPPGEPLQ